MSNPAELLATGHNERATAPTFRSVLLAGLDNRLLMVVFGTLLPLLLAIPAMDPRPHPGLPAHVPQVRFAPLGPEMMTLVVVLALSFMLWVNVRPQARALVNFLAVAISLGAALAIAYASLMIVLWTLIVLGVLGHSSPPLVATQIMLPPLLAMQLIVPMLVLIPAPLIAVIYLRQASLAWVEGGTRAKRHPHATVWCIVASAGLAYTLTLWGGMRAAEVGMERLRSDQAGAVEDALGPLRVAAVLGGEARLVQLYDLPLDASTRSRLDDAYVRVIGHPRPKE